MLNVRNTTTVMPTQAIPHTFEANGTFAAPPGNRYDPITINVPEGGTPFEPQEFHIAENGVTYPPDNVRATKIQVNVPDAHTDQPVEFTENGVYPTPEDVRYDEITVDVPIPVDEETTFASNGIYYAQDMVRWAKVTVNVGGHAELKNSVGEYFGAMEGDHATELNIITTGHVGETALFIIMHRDDLTVPESWTFISKTINNEEATDDHKQWISLYKKEIVNSSETFTINQASSKRICACIWYFENDISVSLNSTLSLDVDSRIYRYSLPPINRYGGIELCVVNNVYTLSTSWNFSETLRVATPYRSFLGGTAAMVRMLAFENPSAQTVVIDAPSIPTGEEDFIVNRLYRFIITGIPTEATT